MGSISHLGYLMNTLKSQMGRCNCQSKLMNNLLNRDLMHIQVCKSSKYSLKIRRYGTHNNRNLRLMISSSSIRIISSQSRDTTLKKAMRGLQLEVKTRVFIMRSYVEVLTYLSHVFQLVLQVEMTPERMIFCNTIHTSSHFQMAASTILKRITCIVTSVQRELLVLSSKL